MNVLIACEFSGVVRNAFIAAGHNAISCDTLPTHDPGPHIQGDIFGVDTRGYDLLIAHPPCTYLCNGGNIYYSKPENKHLRLSAVEFVKKISLLPVPRIAIENPIGHLSSAFRKPDQFLRAWEFGAPYKKDICLWLKNLPPLFPTNIYQGKIKTLDFVSWERVLPLGGNKKSITFPGFAHAMATQWGSLS